jgi:hypothetical protein
VQATKIASPGFKKVANPVDTGSLLSDLVPLANEGPLAKQGPFDVYLANADAIPHIMLEIGRQREMAFRAVGEGTGQSRDLDRYDPFYLHLFLWDRERKRLAGGYRIAQTDLILDQFGFEGLYTSSLCSIDPALLNYLNPALELGRSWINEEYQRSLHPLLGLWKGIGRFVSSHPRYCKLFGAVSISGDYSSISRDLIVRFFRTHAENPVWKGALRPFAPVEDPATNNGFVPDTVAEVSAEVSRIEADGRGIPVLLRQYLKMNATLLGFGYDPGFQNCLDATVLVDLRKAPSVLLTKYMGADGYHAFSEAHGAD